jgi:hypothetical protein
MPPLHRSASTPKSPWLPPRVIICVSRYKIFVVLFLLQLVALIVLHSKLGEQEEHLHGMQFQETLSTDVASPSDVVTSRLRHPEQHQHPQAPQPSVPIQMTTPKEATETYRQKLERMELYLRQLKDSPRIQSCRYRDGVYVVSLAAVSSGSLCPLTVANAKGQGQQQKQQPPSPMNIIYYNPVNRERLLCGHTVPAKSTFELPETEACHEPSRLWPVIPETTAVGMPPVTVRFGTAGRKVNSAPALPFTDCDIPCHSSGRPSLVARRTVDGADWSFTFSMEGPQYFKSLVIDPKAHAQHKYWSTTSYQSEVPLPYYSWAEYKIQEPVLDYDQAIKAGVFLARNCHSKNKREVVVEALQKSGFRVDSLSSCLHNAEIPAGWDRSNKTGIMRHYLFYLAFENQNVDDYITEKLWGPFEAGAVPVYFGAPNVKDHVPPHSIISVSDFASTKDLAMYLQKVANDKELYQEYQKWRTEPLPATFHAKYDFTHIHSTCRTCRWAYAKMYGLGWNHANQSLTELQVGDRNACLDGNGLVTQPFREMWRLGSTTTVSSSRVSFALETGSKETAGSCPLSSKSQALVHDGQLRRTVWQQDGVIDMLLEDLGGFVTTKDDLIWRFETLVQSVSLKNIQQGHVRLQDERTRMTLLTMPAAGVEPTISRTDPTNTASVNAIIDLAIQSQHLPLRLRIIMEDIDTFHKGAEKLENHFGQVMVEDFFNPIEAFVDMAE